VAFFTQKELDEYLHRLEEAKRRRSSKAGTELELFSVQEEAGPGLIFWHPKADSFATWWKSGAKRIDGARIRFGLYAAHYAAGLCGTRAGTKKPAITKTICSARLK